MDEFKFDAKLWTSRSAFHDQLIGNHAVGAIVYGGPKSSSVTFMKKVHSGKHIAQQRKRITLRSKHFKIHNSIRAMKLFFKTESRPHSHKVGVLVTGKSDKRHLPSRKHLKLLQRADIKFITVFVDVKVPRNSQKNRYVLHVDSLEEIMAHPHIIRELICNGTSKIFTHHSNVKHHLSGTLRLLRQVS